LTGKYIGPNSYNLLNDASRLLHNNFRENYKTLLITENGIGIYTGYNAIINSINIEESSWYGVLPFTIDLSIYSANLFQDYYGIVDPEETFSFSEEAGDILNLTHSVSAKGIVANNKNAIQNAKDWVLSKTGNFNNFSPILIKNINSVRSRPYLPYSTQEVIDRFNGTYSWEAVYKKSLNLENPNNSILNYTVDLNSGIDDGIITATINGSLGGNSLSSLRTDYNQLDLYTLCNNVSNSVFKQTLSSRSVNQSIEEISGENQISFSCVFNNDYSNDITNNYSVDINEDSLKCIRTVNFSTTISCKYGDLSTKWQKVQNFYKTQFFPFNLLDTEFKKEFPLINLNPSSISESVSFDQFNAEIKYSCQYSDKRNVYSTDILNISSNVSYSPSINIYASNTSAFTVREHNIQNLACANRSKINISVTAVAKINKNISIAEAAVTQEINRIKSNYTQGILSLLLEDRSISKNNDIKTVTINETWSFEAKGDNILI
jgi:hypothetical protein